MYMLYFGAPYTWYIEKQTKQTNKIKQSKTKLNRTKQKPNKQGNTQRKYILKIT